MKRLQNGGYALEKDDIAALLPPRPKDGNKGTFGRVLIVAGSKNMSGAAYFSAKAAYRCGAGLVRILTPEDNRVILQTQLPEAVMTTYDAEHPDDAVLSAALTWAEVVVLGPGMGMGAAAEGLVRKTLETVHVPTVIDADALNLIAARGIPIPENVILTPHPGEFSRLTGISIPELRADPAGFALRFAKEHHVILAAKDAETVISDGECCFFNESGSSALAKGGSGDVLTGVIAANLACGMKPFPAAVLGVYVHGLAGEFAAETWGLRGVLASETADAAALVLKAYGEGNGTDFCREVVFPW